MHIILVVHCNSGKLQTVGEKGTVSANLLSARRRVNTELHTLVTRQRTQSMHRLRHAGRSWKTAQPPSFWSHHGRACPWRSFASSHASRHETHRLAKRQCHRFQALAAFGAFAWTLNGGHVHLRGWLQEHASQRLLRCAQQHEQLAILVGTQQRGRELGDRDMLSTTSLVQAVSKAMCECMSRRRC